jgi:hypothetical protein
MKNLMKMFLVTISLFTLVACGSNNAANTTPATSNKKVTVLVYMEGTNLESDPVPNGSAATLNINEMLAATASSDVNIVLETGAANKAVSTDPVKSWKTVKRHVISNQKITEVDDLKSINMGTTAALTDFITWGQKTYPADKYVLVFWDHGGGALGNFGGDTDTGTSPLSIDDLRKGVADAVTASGKTFELIGFDACLMATMEVAYNFKDASNYLVASEDIEPGAGWDWTGMMNYLAANPASNGSGIGKAIADSYLAKMKKEGNEGITMSVVVLSKIPALATALASFADWQSGLIKTNGYSAWQTLAYARARSMDFYTSYLDLANTTDMIDINDMLNRLSPEYTGDTTQIDNLIAAVGNAVVYKVADSLRESATGLTLMFPTYTVWGKDTLTKYSSFTFVSAYQNLVSAYSTYASTNVMDIGITAPANNGSIISASTAPSNQLYDQAYIAITDNNGLYYGHQPIWPGIDFTKLLYHWSGSWYTLNGTVVSVLASPASEPVVHLAIPLQVTIAGEKPSYGLFHLIYDYTSETPTYLGYQPDMNNQLYRGYIALKAGDTVIPMAIQVNSDNPFGKWQANGTGFTIPSAGLTFAKTTLAVGNYQLAFMLYDLRMKPSVSASVQVSK